MAKYFIDAAEHINQKIYQVWAPAFYHTSLPAEFIQGKPEPLPPVNRFKMTPRGRRNPTPFREIIDPNQMQRASFPIKTMLDMFRKKVEFELVIEEDVVDIFESLDRYLISVKDDVEMGVERIIEYAKIVVAWRAEVYKHYYRYMQLHPAAKEKLYPNNNPTKNIFHLMAIVGGPTKENLLLDPLRARATPPYDIDKLAPRSIDPNPMDQSLESTLGLSKASAFLVDDGRDFNFDDFLGKS